MKHTLNKKILVLGTMLFYGLAIAQTVNSGELFVRPNTLFSVLHSFNNTATGSFYNDGAFYVYSHFNNDGVVDFLEPNSGETYFLGDYIQKITGSQTSYFNNVLFDNGVNTPYAFELSGAISIANEADFFQGIINNRDFGGQVAFETYGTHINASGNSFVNGLVQKEGDTAFEFPVGDQQFYRYAAISAPDGVSSVFSADYIYANPGLVYPLENMSGVVKVVNDKEYWQVHRDQGSSPVVLTLSWDTDVTPSAILAEPLSALHIVRWDADENMWVDEGGIVDVDAKTVSTVLPIDTFGVFTLGRVKEELILPGNIVVYNGITPNGDGVNDYFRIDNIASLPNNNVQVFNRWGVKVFETQNYDSHGNVFSGESDARLTVNKQRKLPTGTYFYVLSYDFTSHGSTERIKQAGYLYITAED